MLQPDNSAVPRIEEAEQLGAIQLFEKYAETRGMADAAKHKGINILKVGHQWQIAAEEASILHNGWQNIPPGSF